MKVIVAGSRSVNDYGLVKRTIIGCPFMDRDANIEVVSGTARGVDQLGEEVARQNSYKVHRFPADWDRDAKLAGFLRNERMAEFSDALIAIWDGESKGTKHMIDTMLQRKKPVYVVFSPQ